MSFMLQPDPARAIDPVQLKIGQEGSFYQPVASQLPVAQRDELKLKRKAEAAALGALVQPETKNLATLGQSPGLRNKRPKLIHVRVPTPSETAASAAHEQRVQDSPASALLQFGGQAMSDTSVRSISPQVATPIPSPVAMAPLPQPELPQNIRLALDFLAASMPSSASDTAVPLAPLPFFFPASFPPQIPVNKPEPKKAAVPANILAAIGIYDMTDANSAASALKLPKPAKPASSSAAMAASAINGNGTPLRGRIRWRSPKAQPARMAAVSDAAREPAKAAPAAQSVMSVSAMARQTLVNPTSSKEEKPPEFGSLADLSAYLSKVTERFTFKDRMASLKNLFKSVTIEKGPRKGEVELQVLVKVKDQDKEAALKVVFSESNYLSDGIRAESFSQSQMTSTHYYVTVYEMDDKGTDHKIVMEMRMSDLNGELKKVHKGRILTGNTVLEIYKIFRAIAQSPDHELKPMYILDDSKIQLNISVNTVRPVWLKALALAHDGGKTWYQRTLGAKLARIDFVHNIGTHISQNPEEHDASTERLQQRTLRELNQYYDRTVGKMKLNYSLKDIAAAAFGKDYVIAEGDKTIQQLVAALHKRVKAQAKQVKEEVESQRKKVKTQGKKVKAPAKKVKAQGDEHKIYEANKMLVAFHDRALAPRKFVYYYLLSELNEQYQHYREGVIRNGSSVETLESICVKAFGKRVDLAKKSYTELVKEITYKITLAESGSCKMPPEERASHLQDLKQTLSSLEKFISFCEDIRASAEEKRHYKDVQISSDCQLYEDPS